MFMPGSLGSCLPRAALPEIEESIWYPSQSPPAVTITPDDSADIGLNLGVQLAMAVQGVILSICYWRWSALAPSNGTVALWNADERIEPRELIVSKDFTGHSGTGWKRVDFDVPVEISTAKSYFATVWIPESGDGFIYYGGDRFSFPSTPTYSANQLVWAWPNTGSPFPPHGIYKRNGWYKYGALACPDDQVAATNYWVDVVFRGSPLPQPPDPPIVIKWEIPDGYPNLSNTGIPPGTVLTPVVGASVGTTHDGQIIENLDIRDGGISVVHHNCTIRKCKIYFRGGYGIIVYPEYVGTIIEDCDVNSGFRNNGPAEGIGGNPLVIRRCNVYRGQDGIVGFGNYGGGDTSVTQIYEDNFVHSLRSSPGTPHYDCVQFNGGAGNIIVRHNTFHNENTDTSAILIQNLFGPIYGIRIEDNIMAGGGFTSYCVGRTEDPAVDPVIVQYYSNRLHIGAYGYIIDTQTNPVMAGNKLMDHGGIYDAIPPDGFADHQMVRERFFGMPNGASIIPGSIVYDEVPGLTLGISFTLEQDSFLVGVNLPKIRSAGETLLYKVGVWRFTGADRYAGTELIHQETINFQSGVREGWEHLPFTAPVSINIGENILLGVFHTPGKDGRIWFTSVGGVFGDNIDSQFARGKAFNGAGVPYNGFTGGNGLFNYGSDLAPPLNQTGGRPSYNIDPIFEAMWPPVNEPPEATNLSTAELYTLNTPLNLADIVVSDLDTPNVTVTLTLSNPSAGSLSTATSGSVTSTYSIGVWTAHGPVNDVNALLLDVTFTPATDFNSNFTIATFVSDGIAAAVTGTKTITYAPPSLAGSIPLTYGDVRFSANTSSQPVTMSSGTLLKKSITETNFSASILALDNIVVDTCRVNSREGIRVAGSGVDVRNCYLEFLGEPGDHADTIQAYSPTQVGSHIQVTNSAIVAHNTDATAGLFIADYWSGTVTCDNVMFQSGPFGLRLHSDGGCTINVSLKDCFFVGPFLFGPIYLLPVETGIINITHWENVRHATIVDGALVPGAEIPNPYPTTGSITTVVTGRQAAITAGQVTVIANASASTVVTGQQAAITAGSVIVTTTATGSISVDVTGRQAAITAGNVLVTARRSATTILTGRSAAITAGTVSVTALAAGSIPLTYSDARFGSNTTSSSITASSGTILRKSITDTGHTASIIAEGSVIIDTCRIDSAECVRMAGNIVDIRNSYLKATGVGDDHADVIQAYDPGQHSGQIKVTNSAIVMGAGGANNGGLFCADDWGGTVTVNNVMFQGGLYGLILYADAGCTINLYMKDAFFVGPFVYGEMAIEAFGSGVLNITHWENVRHATIVGGVLVPGSSIPEP